MIQQSRYVVAKLAHGADPHVVTLVIIIAGGGAANSCLQPAGRVGAQSEEPAESRLQARLPAPPTRLRYD
jgi:hypothetical protein